MVASNHRNYYAGRLSGVESAGHTVLGYDIPVVPQP